MSLRHGTLGLVLLEPLKADWRLWSECRVQGQRVTGRALGGGGFVAGVGGGTARVDPM